MCRQNVAKCTRNKFHWWFLSVSKRWPVDRVHLFISASTFQKCHRMNHMFCRSIKQPFALTTVCVCVWPINGIPIWTWHFFSVFFFFVSLPLIVLGMWSGHRKKNHSQCMFICVCVCVCMFVCISLQQQTNVLIHEMWFVGAENLIVHCLLFSMIWNTHERTVKKYNVIIWIQAIAMRERDRNNHKCTVSIEFHYGFNV